MFSLNAHSGGVTAAVSRFAYAAAKAGILGMTRALAKELGPTILINAICPGLIETELAKNPVIVGRGGETASLSAFPRQWSKRLSSRKAMKSKFMSLTTGNLALRVSPGVTNY